MQNNDWKKTDNATEDMGRRARNSNCEVFYVSLGEQTSDTCFWNTEDNEPLGEGWFYWCCMPGCIPEGDAMGPFKTSAEAFQDADHNGFINDEVEGAMLSESNDED